MKINKLLYVTDFNELWFDALQSLMSLRKSGLNHVVFLNVIDRDNVKMQRGAGYMRNEVIKLKEMANIRFIDWAEALFEQGLEVGAHIVVGKTVPKVISISEEEGIDLIVTSFTKKSKVDFYSSIEITEILQRSLTPVLVHKFLPETGKENSNPFARPLLALDWSPASDRAIEYIVSMKEAVDNIIVVNIESENKLDSDSPIFVQKVRKECRQKIDKTCDDLANAGIKAEGHLYIGEMIDQIMLAARERRASMIVAGVTPKNDMSELLFGSVPKELIEQTLYPTLFIPPTSDYK